MLHFWVSWLPAMILTSACPALAQTRTGNVSRFKLENYGWQHLPVTHEWVGTSSRLVSIDHQGRVLVAFTTRENRGLSSREHPGLSFHILRFTSEGKVDLSLVLPTSNWFNNGLYLGLDDRIYARVDNALQFFAEQHDANSDTGVWKTLVPCSMGCKIMQSPSRRTLILRDSKERDHHTYIVLDTSSGAPPVVKDCTSSDSDGQAITDRFTYHSTDGIRTDARRWPLCDQKHETELPLDMRNGAIHPLSDEALLLLGTPASKKDDPQGGVDLVAPDGQLKFHQEMPKHDLVDSYWMTSDERGDRFAFSIQTWRGGSVFLDISGKMAARRVVVYTETGQELATVPVNPGYHRGFDFSLSPDGHRLAILDEGVLTVVEIQ
jgi:hypothetical protein